MSTETVPAPTENELALRELIAAEKLLRVGLRILYGAAERVALEYALRTQNDTFLNAVGLRVAHLSALSIVEADAHLDSEERERVMRLTYAFAGAGALPAASPASVLALADPGALATTSAPMQNLVSLAERVNRLEEVTGDVEDPYEAAASYGGRAL
jgi:hypothetical protein